MHSLYMYPIKAPTGTATVGDFASGYTIYVPKGSLASYQTQWSGHAGHFKEFIFMIPRNGQLKRAICLSDTTYIIDGPFIHSAFDEGQTFSIQLEYTGSNLVNPRNLHFDWINSVLSFDFDRAEDFDFEAIESAHFHVEADGLEVSVDIDCTITYRNDDIRSRFEVVNLGTYPFTQDTEGYYASGNNGINSSFSLCKVVFITNTGKVYLDCQGEGESNFDYGIVSNVDMPLQANNNDETGVSVKKNFKGRGKYEETLEYDVPDSGEHAIYVKYRKDGSAHVGADNIRFKVRFD